MPVGAVGQVHLLVRAQWEASHRARVTAARREDFPDNAIVSSVPIRELMSNERNREAIVSRVPGLAKPFLAAMLGADPLVLVAASFPGIGTDQLAELEAELSDIELGPPS